MNKGRERVIKLMIFEAESGVYALFLLLQSVVAGSVSFLGFSLFFFFSFALKLQLVLSQYILSSHHKFFPVVEATRKIFMKFFHCIVKQLLHNLKSKNYQQ